jgi:hypothetical protein
MDVTTRDYPPGDLRASDADRDRALSELNGAFQAGRITADEFDQRSGEALSARTEKQLAALLADLPLHDAAAASPSALEQVHRRVIAARSVMGASAVAAVSLSIASVSNALGSGDNSAHRQLAQQILARQGLSVSIPAPGFDWSGTVIPAIFAALLVMLIIGLHVSHADRPGADRPGLA